MFYVLKLFQRPIMLHIGSEDHFYVRLIYANLTFPWLGCYDQMNLEDKHRSFSVCFPFFKGLFKTEDTVTSDNTMRKLYRLLHF